jgi:hypothetical protein
VWWRFGVALLVAAPTAACGGRSGLDGFAPDWIRAGVGYYDARLCDSCECDFPFT